MKISELTTQTGKGVGVTSDGYFVKSDGSLVGGYRRTINAFGGSSVHISPWATTDVVHMEAVTGHELIHAMHHSVMGIVNRNYTESVAYRYSAGVYLRNGYLGPGFNMWTKSGIWANYNIVPNIYKLPVPYFGF